MIAPKYVSELADEFNFTSREIETFWFAFLAINRVSHIRTYTELENTICEIYQNKEYTYEQLPQRLKDIVYNAIKTNQPLGKFYGDIDNITNLRKFIQRLKSKWIQPKDYIFQGIITYTSLARGNNTNNVTVITYGENSHNLQEDVS